MAPNDTDNPDGWTFRTLLIYINSLDNAQKLAVDAALKSAKEAVSKSEASVDRRLEQMNEFRKALDDSGRTYMPRIESERMHAATKDKIDDIILRLNGMANRAHGRSDSWGWIAMVAGAILAVLGIVSYFNGEP